MLWYSCCLLIDNFNNNKIYSNKRMQNSKNNIICIKLKNEKFLNIDIEAKKDDTGSIGIKILNCTLNIYLKIIKLNYRRIV